MEKRKISSNFDISSLLQFTLNLSADIFPQTLLYLIQSDFSIQSISNVFHNSSKLCLFNRTLNCANNSRRKPNFFEEDDDEV